MPQNHDEIDQLQEIMAELPDSSAYPEERRKHSLTKDDVLIIFRIARIATGHKCPFEGIDPDEAVTVQTMAKSVNKTQKIATGIMITGMVSAVLSGLWFAIKHVATEWVHNGGAIK